MTARHTADDREMDDPDDKMVWEVLLRQAEANLKQAVANEGTSGAIRMLTQRLLCKGSAAALEPGRLEAGYAANGDAEALKNRLLSKPKAIG